MQEPRYHGRFAPSPTGPLHFGSLVAALASYLEARVKQGQWQVRIDDLDQVRQIEGMDTRILRTLEAFGLTWDGEVSYQSQNTEHYRQALQQLSDAGQVYVCQCTRRQIKANARSGIEGPIYPGTCRNLGLQDAPGHALRIRTDANEITFCDGLYGLQRQRVQTQIGDFVIRRADGFFAYQLAVVIDDHLSDITHVVRGADLLPSTARQIYLQRLLGLPQPSYLHVPLVLDTEGRKLSKRDHARPVASDNPVPALYHAWQFLQQPKPPLGLSLADFWQWARAHWQPSLIQPTQQSTA